MLKLTLTVIYLYTFGGAFGGAFWVTFEGVLELFGSGGIFVGIFWKLFEAFLEVFLGVHLGMLLGAVWVHFWDIPAVRFHTLCDFLYS